MSTDTKGPPEGTAEWKPDFNEEEQSQVAALGEKMESQVRFMSQIREALGLSQVDFLQLLQEDECAGLPFDVLRSSLTVTKLRDFVYDRGGKLTITIQLDEKEFVVSY